MPRRPIALRGLLKLSIGLAATALIVGACSGKDNPSAAQPAHPGLECGDERSVIGNYDLVGPGLETARAALDDRLDYYRRMYGGETVHLGNNQAALRVDGSNVVIVEAQVVAEGGFLVQEDYFCVSFQPW